MYKVVASGKTQAMLASLTEAIEYAQDLCRTNIRHRGWVYVAAMAFFPDTWEMEAIAYVWDNGGFN